MTFTKLKKKRFYQHLYFGNENKEKHPIYVSKKYCQEKHIIFIFSLIKAPFLSRILNLKNAKHLKEYMRRINPNSMTF